MKKSTDRNPWRRFVFLFCASLVACQSAFGDYKSGNTISGVGGGTSVGGVANAGNTAKAGNTHLGGAGNGGATSGSVCNSEGIFRCTDTAVEVCTNHQWKGFVSCSRDLCDADRGRCMTCAPGSNRCSAFNLQTCASTGDIWNTTKQCDTAAYCDSVSNTCFACLTGEAFCSGASLYRCNSTQNGWNVEDCGSSDLCDSSAQTCGEACPSKDWVSCNGPTLIGCDGNGHHTILDNCSSSQLCQKTLEKRAEDPAAWSGKCEQGCSPKTYQCNPNNLSELLACSPSGLSWEHIDNCGTPELCDAVNQRCKPGCGVPPGTYQCNGARLEQCSADGSTFQVLKVCEDESHCNAQKRDCVPCVPGEFQCTNATLQTCSNDLTWSTVKTCASVPLCDATHGQCVDPGCSKAGAFQCSDAVLQQCASDLTAWTDKQTCATAALCDDANGRCVTPECQYPNTYRCQGNTRQICDDTTRKWKDVNTCSSDQVCDLTATSGCMSTCPVIPWRCNTVGTLTAAQSCSMVNGVPKWTTIETCATAALCTVGDGGAACTKPICDPLQHSCDGSTLKVCSAGRNTWDTVKTCAAGEICDAIGGQCDVCVPNTYTCYQVNNNVGRQLLKCDAAGQANTVLDNCDSAARCYTSSDKLTGYCYRCDAGNTQCVGSSQVQTCSPDRRGWNTPTSCANACVNSGDFDYCAACAANEVQCVQTQPPGSTHTCSSDQKSWGNPTACTKGLGCIDNGTADYCASTCSPSAWECLNGTTRHQCNADGKGWGANVSECADTSHLKACSSGQFSGTTACTGTTPSCFNGQCVPCLGTTTECIGSNQLHSCYNNKWVDLPACSGDTPVCSGSACVQCISTSASSTCPSDTSRHYCTTANTWTTSLCRDLDPKKPYCENGACVQCKSSDAVCTDDFTLQTCENGAPLAKSCSTRTSGEKAYCFTPPSGGAAYCADCNSNRKSDCLNDGVTLRQCNTTDGTFALSVCSAADASYCVEGVNGGACGCSTGSKAQCPTDKTLKTCNTDTGTWDTTTCPPTEPTCDDSSGSGQCVACKNSPWTCTGSNTRYRCNNNANETQTCPGTEICDPADDNCKAPTCNPGEFRCDGTTLQKCNDARTGWTPVKTCTGSTPVCYANNPPSGTSSGDCVVCTPGATACDGTTGVHTCNANGSGWGATTYECADDGNLKTCSGGVLSSTQKTACPTATPICNLDTNQCVAPACNAGEKHCNGSVQETCNSKRTGWVALACTEATPVCQSTTGNCICSSTSCSGSTPICNGTTCVPENCTAGQHKCSSDNSTQQVCTDNDWHDELICANTTDAPVCQTTGLCGCSKVQDCVSVVGKPVCSNSTQKCVACTGSQTSCLDAHTAQICQNDAWAPIACASSTPVCVAETGTCGACNDNDDCAAASAPPLCNKSSHTCVACMFPSDCSGTKPICDDGGVCVACSPPGSACLTGGICQIDGSCLVLDGG